MGRVLAIGGLKEKALAAHRQGIRRLVAPRDNERDLSKIPMNVRKEMEFIFASTMDQVISEAILLDDARVDTLTEIAGAPLVVDPNVNDSRPQPEYPPPADSSFGDDVAADGRVRRKRNR